MRAILLTALLLIGCGGSNSGDSNSGGSNSCGMSDITITCIDVATVDQVCTNSVNAGVTKVDIGEVTRRNRINFTIQGNNATSSDWGGFYSVTVDKGCNGSKEEWEAVSEKPLPIFAKANVGAGESRECLDMPLGEGTMTATLYDASMTAVACVTATFTLVE